MSPYRQILQMRKHSFEHCVSLIQKEPLEGRKEMLEEELLRVLSDSSIIDRHEKRTESKDRFDAPR